MDSVTHLSSSACLNVMSHRTSESMYQIRHLLKCFAKQKDQFTYFPQRSCKMKLNGCTGTSQEVPNSSLKHSFAMISLLHIQLWGISMGNWDQGICSNRNDSITRGSWCNHNWPRSRTPPGPLTYPRFLLKSPLMGIISPNSSRGKSRVAPYQKLLDFGQKESAARRTEWSC